MAFVVTVHTNRRTVIEKSIELLKSEIAKSTASNSDYTDLRFDIR